MDMSPNSLQTIGPTRADENPSSQLKEFESLTRKYAEEKERRVRSDGTDQYMELEDSSKFAYLAEDPFVDHGALNARPSPLKDGQEVKVIILGAGHGGLIFAARLVEGGMNPDDIRLVDIAVRTFVFSFPPHRHCFDPVASETGMARIHYSSNPRRAITSQSLTFPNFDLGWIWGNLVLESLPRPYVRHGSVGILPFPRGNGLYAQNQIRLRRGVERPR